MPTSSKTPTAAPNTPRRTTPKQPPAGPPRRLVVELGPRANEAIEWLTEAEQLNKTTVTNRALQAYKVLVEAQLAGKRLVLEGDDGSRHELTLL